MTDPTGAVISELVTANVASGRVRGGEPKTGDALGPGSYQRFVVIVRLGFTVEHRAPVQEVRLGFRAYGVTYQDAAALAGEIVDVLDDAGPRLSATGVRTYQTLIDSGGGAHKDPDTKQPYEEGVIALYAGTARAA